MKQLVTPTAKSRENACMYASQCSAALHPAQEMVPLTVRVAFPSSLTKLRKALTGRPSSQPDLDLRTPFPVILDRVGLTIKAKRHVSYTDIWCLTPNDSAWLTHVASVKQSNLTL